MSAETKWTPGPWVAEGKVTPVGDPEDIDMLYCGHARPHSENGWRGDVCHIQSTAHIAGGISNEEAEANTRLTAAAPELYEALRVIRHEWSGHAEKCALALNGSRSRCDCDWPQIAEQCDKALAKARGEQ